MWAQWRKTVSVKRLRDTAEHRPRSSEVWADSSHHHRWHRRGSPRSLLRPMTGKASTAARPHAPLTRSHQVFCLLSSLRHPTAIMLRRTANKPHPIRTAALPASVCPRASYDGTDGKPRADARSMRWNRTSAQLKNFSTLVDLQRDKAEAPRTLHTHEARRSFQSARFWAQKETLKVQELNKKSVFIRGECS